VPGERPENMATNRKGVEIPPNCRLGTDTDQPFIGATMQDLRFKSHWDIMLYFSHERIDWWPLECVWLLLVYFVRECSALFLRQIEKESEITPPPKISRYTRVI
jgi:hypothetical protein